MSNPAPEQIREFVIAGHFDLARIKAMLAENPELLNAAHPWSESDHETAIMAAAQTGNRPVAEYLLERGAPLDICTAAMLGRRAEVAAMLDKDPSQVNAHGAHGIPLLAYAGLCEDVELVKMLASRGASEGASFALHNAVSRGHLPMARWLLENMQPDLGWKNYEGKTALMTAAERGSSDLIMLLKKHGAKE